MLTFDDLLERLDRVGPHPIRNWPMNDETFPGPMEPVDKNQPNQCIPGCSGINCLQ